MNKTVNINLANNFFHIDEPAYAILKKYLSKLELAFKATTGKESILEDIEARIAELFLERKQHENYVINEDDVEAVITILGNPEDFVLDDEDAFEKEGEPAYSGDKKLFRDPDDKYIGGVVSGLAHYFGLDVVGVRLIWLVLGLFSAGTFTLIYIILWAVIPEAKTTTEKLKMKGEPINIDTIQKSIKEEFDNVSEKFKNMDYKKASSSVKKKSRKLFGFLEEFFSLLFSVAGKLIGFLLATVSFIIILSLFISFISLSFIGVMHWPFDFFTGWFDLTNAQGWVFAIALFFVVFIPLALIFMLGVRLIVPSSRFLGTTGGWVSFGLWIVSIVTLIIFGFYGVRSHSTVANYQEEKELFIADKDTLFVSVNEKKPALNYESFGIGGKHLFYDSDDKRWIVGEDVLLNIKSSSNKKSLLVIDKEADGLNYERALEKAKTIAYEWKLEDNKLVLDDYWKTLQENKFHDQQVRIILWLEEGQVVKLSRSTKGILKGRIANDQGFYRREITDHLWQMGATELECLDCDAVTEKELMLNYKDEDDNFQLKIDGEGLKVKTS